MSERRPKATESSRIAGRWAAVAGIAWLVGFAQFGGVMIAMGLDPTSLLFGVATYGAWALVLGLLLLRRPTRTVLAASLGFAVFVIVFYWVIPAGPGPSVELPVWLAWSPDAVAGMASLAGLSSGRR